MSNHDSSATSTCSQASEYQFDDNVILEPGQTELKRLKLSHAVMMSHFDHLYSSLVLAPMDLNKSGLSFLDQACANGQWLESLRDKIPSGIKNRYVGTDIVSSYFPDPPPADMSFQIQSMTAPWPADMKGTFDMVHSRYSLAGAGTCPLKQVIQGEIELLKPGGWIQLEEMDMPKTVGFAKNGPAVTKLYKLLSEIFDMLGAGAGFAAQIAVWMSELGLVDIVQQDIVMKYGSNAEFPGSDGTSVEQLREMGTECMAITAHGLIEGSKNLPSALKSVPSTELPDLARQVVEECNTIGSGYVMTAVYGRKPL